MFLADDTIQKLKYVIVYFNVKFYKNFLIKMTDKVLVLLQESAQEEWKSWAGYCLIALIQKEFS